MSIDFSSMGCGRSLPLARSLAVHPTLSQAPDISGVRQLLRTLPPQPISSSSGLPSSDLSTLGH